jgi:LysM repeat protein
MKMTKLIRSFTLFTILGALLTSCTFTEPAENQVIQPTSVLPEVAVIELAAQADTSVPFDAVGQIISYSYFVTNTGTASAPGPVSVTGAICPEVNTVGNLDDMLDVNETVTCASSYTITQVDLDAGSATNIATATVNGINSNQAVTTVAIVQPEILKLTKTAAPATYDRVGQAIAYTYVITNNGAESLGPGQFIVTDSGISTPINCGEATLVLASNETVTCSATYTVTQADMDTDSVSTSAIASGGGVAPSQPASAAITKSAVAQSPSNLTAGTTINHQVTAGEWLWQIARCYGADPKVVRDANPPTPSLIKPGTTVVVPNIGSVGTMYGPPCVGTHTVQSGDTWSSIAQTYNANLTVLQMVNPGSLAIGSVLKVPLNSASTSTAVSIPITGSTGDCVDLTRSHRLAGLNAVTTRFNICGTTDASENTRALTINISQSPQDAGVDGLSQNIIVPSSIETSTLLTDVNSLIVEDMNYDGNDDFRILRDLPAGPNIPYLYYIYDPAARRFIYNPAYEDITSPEFPGNSQIRSQWRESAAQWGIDTYTIVNNTPVLTQRETWEALNDAQATHVVTVFNADGTSQVTVNEIVPLPVP